jgi:hypothetical protein
MLDPQVTDTHAPRATTRLLRQFAALWMLFFGALALWQYFRHGNRTWAAIFAGLSVTLGPAGLLRPAIIRPVFIAWTAIALAIGAVVSRVVLAMLYYFLFTLVGVLFRLIRRDALNLRRSTTATYWHVRPKVKDLRQYLRQS